jgi:hypothetical protein
MNALFPFLGAKREKKNKRQIRKERWQREGGALWHARLPPVRNQDSEAAGLQETHVSNQQQSAFFENSH